MSRSAGGFTLVELALVIILLGILAVFALSRMDTSAYRAMEFHDQTVAALRYAQKTATSHRRRVCVSFPDDHTLALSIDTDRVNPACDTALLLPGAPDNQLVSGDPLQAKFNPTPATLNFAADGSSSGATLQIQGAADIVVSGVTGYVQ